MSKTGGTMLVTNSWLVTVVLLSLVVAVVAFSRGTLFLIQLKLRLLGASSLLTAVQLRVSIAGAIVVMLVGSSMILGPSGTRYTMIHISCNEQ